jgi:hypothetical protein
MGTKLSLVAGLVLAGFCAAASAQQLPKSGTINLHTGWKVAGEVVEVSDKKFQGHGSAIGTSFNDAGSGPMHGGPASCFYTFFASDNGVKNKGFCAFGDTDGDRLFTDWHGANAAEGTEGTNVIVGGTGKYAGIQGKGSWKSKDTGPNGQHLTTQRFEYRLP